MSQVTAIAISNQTFPNFRTALNNSFNAINSSHIGSTTPASAVAGTIWIDNSVTDIYTMKVYDGTDNLTLFSINTSTNAVTLPSGVSITESDPSAIPFSIALGS
jgi:hypothetical protein